MSAIFYKNLFLLLITLAAFVPSHAQSPALTLDECYTLSKQNYPMIRQRELIKKTKDYSIENAGKGYLPQWVSSGQLTYQSDVTQIPFKVPGFDIPTPSKTQYKVYGEVDQTIYDGGNIKWQKQTQQANADIQDQNLEVQLYALKDRVNQIFFGILLINEQIKQNELQQQDLQAIVNTTQAAVDNGSGYRRSVDEAKVELLNAQQTNINLKGNRKAYIDMLALFINQPLDENVALEKPAEVELPSTINRPELKLYDYQKKLYDVQEKQLSVNVLPKVSAFIQGGYSNPPLNALKATPAFYYIGGVKFNWPLGSLYTNKNERKILQINRQTQDIERETFVFNTNQTLRQQNNDIMRLKQLIEKDNDIIALRASIKSAAKAQVQNGVITTHDYITYVNDENMARQEFLLHQIQLLNTIYNYKNTSGN